uniref:Uncharacterized protein n=1 Tax=Noccaea caerulescens TaxID=107243 RepID=A0A1J3H489_NOCCA
MLQNCLFLLLDNSLCYIPMDPPLCSPHMVALPILGLIITLCSPMVFLSRSDAFAMLWSLCLAGEAKASGSAEMVY